LQDPTISLAAALAQPVPSTLAGASEQHIIAHYVAEAPELDKQALCNSVWSAGLEGLRDLIAEGRKFAMAFDQVHLQVIETIWEKDFSDCRSQIAAHGQSLFGFLMESIEPLLQKFEVC